jgi:ATP-dependent Zn protease
VWLHLPSEKDRVDILKLNCLLRPIKLDNSVDLTAIAKEAISFSGADLANVINESIFYSLRRKSDTVSMDDVTSAYLKCKQVVVNRNKNVSTSAPASPRHGRFFAEDISTALE